MNGPLVFHEMRSSPSRSPWYRVRHAQRRHVGTGSWHRSRAIPVLSVLVLWLPGLLSSSQAQGPLPSTPITSSGLHTQVTLSATPPAGMVQYDITGGTRPGGVSGTNLFHSFGDFNVPTNNIANFLNDSGLATSNILGRVTGGNLSNIYGTIQTTGFGNANLFLMNPAGFLFGPNATVNVGGMMAFTTADYLRLVDGVRFTAIPNANADALLTASPVASFGFLGSNPEATITVQGSQFSVTDGQRLSLVGGNVTIQSGTLENGAAQLARLSAPKGMIQLASATSPGEFDATTLQPLPNVDGASFTSFGSVTLALGSTMNFSGIHTVSIRGGQFVLSIHDTVITTATSAPVADTVTLSPGSVLMTANAGADSDAANVTIVAGTVTIDGATITTDTQGAGAGGSIFVNANSVMLQNAGTLSAKTSGPDGTGPGGNITVEGNTVQINTSGTITAQSTGLGNAGTVTIQGLVSQAQSVLIDGPGSGIFTTAKGTGAGGNISIEASQFALSNRATLSAQTAGSGNAGNITVMAPSFSMSAHALMSTGTDNGTTGHGGNISVQADDVLLTDNARIDTNTSGSGDAGSIAITAQDRISLTDSRMNSSTDAVPGKPEGGQGGQITLHAPTIDISNGQIITLSSSSGNAGNVLLETAHLTLDASGLEASAFESGSGGDITIRGLTGADSSAGQVTLRGASQVLSDTSSTGNAGTITIQTAQLMMQDNSLISTTSQGQGTLGTAGNITLNASQSLRVASGSLIQSGSIALSEGNAGNITVTAPAITLDVGTISTTTESAGNAGAVMIKTNSLTVQNGGQITSSSVIVEDIPTGSAGSITIQGQGLASPAKSVLIDGSGSGLFTDTQGTRAGGNIFVNADSVTLQNGGTFSAKTSGTEVTATGGTITVDATNTVTMNSASITANSKGTADAGSIDITATNGFLMQNSTITTLAGQGASGGNIKVTTAPSATVLLENSLISASVADGPGGGGNISIDPQFVILQNSQILAQAAQGQGGAITITTNLFLPYANSKVNADSGSGVNGTVTIQSPNAPISGQIQPLGKSPLLATSLLNQRCASLAGGEFSSFTVAGRDSLPTEPGGWLSSPLAILSAGTGLESMPSGTPRAGTTPLLSLRQIAPPGFLTQAFAVEQTGCTS